MSHTDELRATLDHLHQELEQVSSHDPEVRKLLRHALREISDKLEAREQGAEDATAIASVEQVDLLRATAAELEVRHPGLASALGSVVDALSRMGI
ncbi:MAG TPA: DUF4404 family protein [Nannocystis sp.]